MKILKMMWLASFPAFVLTHILVYAQYEGLYVYLNFDDAGNPSAVMHKNTYFNLVLGLMVLVNLFALILGNLPPYMPKDMIFTPQKKLWLSSSKNSLIFFINFNHWAKGLGLIGNLFFCWMVLMIYSVNIKQIYDISWLIYLFFVLAVVWIGSFFYIFNLTPEKLASGDLDS